jgi:hypothetical protein
MQAQNAITQLSRGSAVVVSRHHGEWRIISAAQQRQAKKEQYFSRTSQTSHEIFLLDV